MSALAIPMVRDFRGVFQPIGSHIVRTHPVRRGVGADPGQTAFTLGTPLAGGAGILGGAALTSTGITAGALATAGITAGIGLVAAAIALWMSRKGPKQNVITTGFVNQAEPLLQQNLAAWNASPKDCANQTAAVQNFQQIWNAVVGACANPDLGDPGHSCMDDRLPSGVTFNTGSPANFNIVGNGMYDWFSYYLDPILNDPAAAGCCPPQPCYDPACTSLVPLPPCTPSAQSAAAGSSSSAGAGSVAGIPAAWLLIGAALLVGLWVMS